MKSTVLLSFLILPIFVHCHDLETDAIIADEINIFGSFGFAADLEGETIFTLNAAEIIDEFNSVHNIESKRQFVANSSKAVNSGQNHINNPRVKMPTCANGELNDEGWGICNGGDLGHIEKNIRMARVAAIEFCSQLPDATSKDLVPYYLGPDTFSSFDEYGYPEIAEYHHDTDIDIVSPEILYSIEDSIIFKCAYNISYGSSY